MSVDKENKPLDRNGALKVAGAFAGGIITAAVVDYFNHRIFFNGYNMPMRSWDGDDFYNNGFPMRLQGGNMMFPREFSETPQQVDVKIVNESGRSVGMVLWAEHFNLRRRYILNDGSGVSSKLIPDNYDYQTVDIDKRANGVRGTLTIEAESTISVQPTLDLVVEKLK
jgi:hypothetical protein